MGTWERGNFVVKTQLMTNHWEIFIDCERGKSKEYKCEGIFWEEALLQWKRKSKIEWSKEVEITYKAIFESV
jgi:hypothetical protein